MRRSLAILVLSALSVMGSALDSGVESHTVHSLDKALIEYSQTVQSIEEGISASLKQVVPESLKVKTTLGANNAQLSLVYSF